MNDAKVAKKNQALQFRMSDPYAATIVGDGTNTTVLAEQGGTDAAPTKLPVGPPAHEHDRASARGTARDGILWCKIDDNLPIKGRVNAVKNSDGRVQEAHTRQRLA